MNHLIDNLRDRGSQLAKRAGGSELAQRVQQSELAQRAREIDLSTGPDRRAFWQRAKVTLGALWRPRRGDVSLPPWLHLLVGLSDDGIRVPGTRVTLGLDALLGTFLPGAGDAFGGVTSVAIMAVAWRRGAPRRLLLKMLGIATVDIVFGSIPIVGDVFDLGFHANRKNLTLLEDHLRDRTRAERASKASAILIFTLLVCMMLAVLAAAVGLVVVSWKHVF